MNIPDEAVVAAPSYGLNHARVESALRELIDYIDHDTHKFLECDEDEGRDRYPELAASFIAHYRAGI